MNRKIEILKKLMEKENTYTEIEEIKEIFRKFTDKEIIAEKIGREKTYDGYGGFDTWYLYENIENGVIFYLEIHGGRIDRIV